MAGGIPYGIEPAHPVTDDLSAAQDRRHARHSAVGGHQGNVVKSAGWQGEGRDRSMAEATTAPEWDIAVFAVNDRAVIERALTSVKNGIAGRHAHLTLLLNGTTDDTAAVAQDQAYRDIPMSIYLFRAADKANALNWYMHELRRPANTYFFIDAYSRLEAGALDALAGALRDQPQAWLASGIWTNGRSARHQAARTLQGGLVNGGLFAMRRGFADRFADRGLRLPTRLYRGDGLLSSMANHSLDPRNPWDTTRIVGVADARFEILPFSPFRWRAVRQAFRREVRQARGAMENAAIKSIIYEGGYEALPEDSNRMIADWLRTGPPRPASLRGRAFAALAERQMRDMAPLPAEDLRPRLIHTQEGR